MKQRSQVEMGLTPVGGSENSFSEYFDLRTVLYYLFYSACKTELTGQQTHKAATYQSFPQPYLQNETIKKAFNLSLSIVLTGFSLPRRVVRLSSF